MEHIAYARKYRPKNFDEIVGQEHIATTLKNAIAQNNLAHAYLFSGPRGIGKTSTARVLAKALNCATGPTDNPCDKCLACNEIRGGRSLDVLEIDGASNRGIDEIRTLRENVKFAPTSNRFKIYIIDEVHMLTTEAFNALLKTLEEPPKHVKFIFATTEPHKVLATILSRCQRFDFRRITTDGIVTTLKKLSATEKIKIEEEALYAVARSADGSLRDAEVILDQINSFSKGKIKLKDVNSVLGLVAQDVIISIVANLDAKHLKDNLALLDNLVRDGKDSAQIASSLIVHFRNMMLIKCNSDKLVSLPKEDKEIIKKQSEKYTLESILYSIAVLSQTSERIKRQGMGRLFLEMALVKLSDQSMLVPAEVLLDKIKDIETKLTQISGTAISGGLSSMPKQKITQPKPEQMKIDPETAPKSIAATSVLVETEPGDLLQDNKNKEFDQDQLRKLWPHVIKAVKQNKISLGLYLSEGEFMDVRGNTVQLGFLPEYDFHRENLEQNQREIEKIAGDLLGSPIKLDMIKCEAGVETTESQQVLEEESKVPATETIEEGDMNDFIQSAMDVFNGHIVSSDD
ncbi:MAG: DNA polymerase III subunit gamma/tau [PVC group bacterium]|nr:DNA polymerase III subunit gamma/tau [PVC group bacterium]